ncbi:Methylthioribulose-1-phosphate dehydratase, partial [Coemansia sp. RSA 2050]
MASHQQSAASAADSIYGNELVTSTDQHHPANLIPELCRQFYRLGWVTGTGGGISIRSGNNVFIAPSGVQKERISPSDLF